MRKLLKIVPVILLAAAGGCDELFAPEETPPAAATGSYNYTFTCSATGRSHTVPIPNRLSATCRQSWEFYARTYGCNDADRFGEANQRKAACP